MRENLCAKKFWGRGHAHGCSGWREGLPAGGRAGQRVQTAAAAAATPAFSLSTPLPLAFVAFHYLLAPHLCSAGPRPTLASSLHACKPCNHVRLTHVVSCGAAAGGALRGGPPAAAGAAGRGQVCVQGVLGRGVPQFGGQPAHQPQARVGTAVGRGPGSAHGGAAPDHALRTPRPARRRRGTFVLRRHGGAQQGHCCAQQRGAERRWRRCLRHQRGFSAPPPCPLPLSPSGPHPKPSSPNTKTG